MEVYYKPSDIVWVKLGPFWWPGEVVDKSKVPEDITESLKKDPVAFVKFFDDDEYFECVKTSDHIYHYNCERKNGFIKKGMDAFRANNTKLKSFPKDVSTAEVKTGGNTNILSEPMFTPECKKNYGESFSTPSPKKPKNGNKKSKKSTPVITHRRFLGYDDYKAHILIQFPGKDRESDGQGSVLSEEPLPKFTCPICHFVTDKLGILTVHTQSHVKDVYVPVSPTKKTPKRKKKKLSDDEDDDAKKTKIKRKYKKKTKIDQSSFAERSASDTAHGNVLENETDNLPLIESKDVCNDIIADWDDESNQDTTEEMDTTVLDSTITSEVNTSNEITVNEASTTKDSVLDSTFDPSDGDKFHSTLLPEDNHQTETIQKTSEEKKEKGPNISCFDFDENEEDTKIPNAISGRKIPRVIPVSDKRKSFSFDDELVEEDEEELRKKILSDSVQLAKEGDTQKKDEEAEDLEKTYKSLMESTSKIELPEIPNALKSEQNFHCAKTVKFPDKDQDDVSKLEDGTTLLGIAKKVKEAEESLRDSEVCVESSENFDESNTEPTIGNKSSVPEVFDEVVKIPEEVLDMGVKNDELEAEKMDIKSSSRIKENRKQKKKTTENKSEKITAAEALNTIVRSKRKFEALTDNSKNSLGSKQPTGRKNQCAETVSNSANPRKKSRKLKISSDDVKNSLNEISDSVQVEETFSEPVTHPLETDKLESTMISEKRDKKETKSKKEINKKKKGKKDEKPLNTRHIDESEIDKLLAKYSAEPIRDDEESDSNLITEVVADTSSTLWSECSGEDITKKSDKIEQSISETKVESVEKTDLVVSKEKSTVESANKPEEKSPTVAATDSTDSEQKEANLDLIVQPAEVDTDENFKSNDLILETQVDVLDQSSPRNLATEVCKTEVELKEEMANAKIEPEAVSVKEKVPKRSSRRHKRSSEEQKDIPAINSETKTNVDRKKFKDKQEESDLPLVADSSQVSKEEELSVVEQETQQSVASSSTDTGVLLIHEKNPRESTKKNDRRSSKEHKKESSEGELLISDKRELGAGVSSRRSSRRDRGSLSKQEPSTANEGKSAEKINDISKREDSNVDVKEKPLSHPHLSETFSTAFKASSSSFKNKKSEKNDKFEEEGYISAINSESDINVDETKFKDKQEESDLPLSADSSQISKEKLYVVEQETQHTATSSSASNSDIGVLMIHDKNSREITKKNDQRSSKDNKKESLDCEQFVSEKRQLDEAVSSRRSSRRDRRSSSKQEPKRDDISKREDSNVDEKEKPLTDPQTREMFSTASKDASSSYLKNKKSEKNDKSAERHKNELLQNTEAKNSNQKESHKSLIRRSRSHKWSSGSRRDSKNSKNNDSVEDVTSAVDQNQELVVSNRSSRSKSHHAEQRDEQNLLSATDVNTDDKHSSNDKSPNIKSSKDRIHSPDKQKPTSVSQREDRKSSHTSKNKTSWSKHDHERLESSVESDFPKNDRVKADKKDIRSSHYRSRSDKSSSRDLHKPSHSREESLETDRGSSSHRNYRRSRDHSDKHPSKTEKVNPANEKDTKTSSQNYSSLKKDKVERNFLSLELERMGEKRSSYRSERRSKDDNSDKKSSESGKGESHFKQHIDQKSVNCEYKEDKEKVPEFGDLSVHQEQEKTSLIQTEKEIIVDEEISSDEKQKQMKSEVVVPLENERSDEKLEFTAKLDDVQRKDTINHESSIKENFGNENISLVSSQIQVASIPSEDHNLSDSIILTSGADPSQKKSEELNDLFDPILNSIKVKPSEIIISELDKKDNSIPNDLAHKQEVKRRNRKPSRWDQKEPNTVTDKKSGVGRWDQVNEGHSTQQQSVISNEIKKVDIIKKDDSEIIPQSDSSLTLETEKFDKMILQRDVSQQEADQIELIFGSSPLPKPQEDNLFTEEEGEELKEIDTNDVQKKDPKKMFMKKSKLSESARTFNETDNDKISSFERSVHPSDDLMESVESQVARITHYEEPHSLESTEEKPKPEEGLSKIESSFDTPEKKTLSKSIFDTPDDKLNVESVTPEGKLSPEKKRPRLLEADLRAQKPDITQEQEKHEKIAPKSKKNYLLLEKSKLEKLQKSPDLTEISLQSTSKSCSDKANEVATKLTNPKKRFVKSFEDFELNQQKEKSVDIPSPVEDKVTKSSSASGLVGKSPIVFKLKKQLLSKIGNVFDEDSEGCIDPSKTSTFVKIPTKSKAINSPHTKAEVDLVIDNVQDMSNNEIELDHSKKSPIVDDSSHNQNLEESSGELLSKDTCKIQESAVEPLLNAETNDEEIEMPKSSPGSHQEHFESGSSGAVEFTIDTTLSNIDKTEDLGNSTQLDIPSTQSETLSKVEEETPRDDSETEIITKNFPLENKKEEPEFVSIDGNLTVVSEKELEEGQVEITASMSNKKPINLMNFSMDFSDDSNDTAFEVLKKENIQSITESLDVTKTLEDEHKVVTKPQQTTENTSSESVTNELHDEQSLQSAIIAHLDLNFDQNTAVQKDDHQNIENILETALIKSNETVETVPSNASSSRALETTTLTKILNKTTDLETIKETGKAESVSPVKRNERKVVQKPKLSTSVAANEPLVIYNTVKSSTITDMCDLEDHIPSQIVCAKNVLINEEVMKVAGIGIELAKEGSLPKIEPPISKLLTRLTSDKTQDESTRPSLESKKTEMKMETNTAKNLIKPFMKGQNTAAHTLVGVTNTKSGNKAIILSEKIIRPARDVVSTNPQLKRTYEDIEDSKPYIISKTQKIDNKRGLLTTTKVPMVSSSKSGAGTPTKLLLTNPNRQTITLPKFSGKAKILNQTIIRPAGELSQVKAVSSVEDNVDFDINSMPIVLSDELLTPESIENMPIVLGDNIPKSGSTEKLKLVVDKKETHNAVKILNNSVSVPSSISHSTALKTHLVKKPTIPKILQTPAQSQRIIRQATSTKPGKLVLVPESSSKTVQMKKPNIVRRSMPLSGVTTTPKNVTPETTGHKIMIVTNQQGQQQRLLLTPAHQKMFGMQLPKAGKTMMKSAVTLKTPVSKTQTTIPSNLTSTSKVQGISTQKFIRAPVSSGHLVSPQLKLATPRKVQKVYMPNQQTTKLQPQKTILIKNQQGQTVRRIQGADDTLLDKQVAEQLEAIKVSSLKSQQRNQELIIKTSGSKPSAIANRKSYSKRPELKQNLVSQPKMTVHSTVTTATASRSSEPVIPALTPIKVDKKPEDNQRLLHDVKPIDNKPLERPLNQLVIQDNMGNQTTVTEGQILALPSETVDGQPQSYMLVTLDESGNLTPLNNEALMSLDPSLAGLTGGDLSNMVLQLDPGLTKDGGSQTAQLQAVAPVPNVQEKLKPNEVEMSRVVPPKPVEQVLQTVEQTAAQVQVTCNINGEPTQQIILTGDPLATQKFLDSLSEGNTDLASILANAEGSSFLIQADGQQILINTEPTDAQMLQANSIVAEQPDQGNPMFATHPVKNQDILAAALADTDVFQQEQISSQGKGMQLSPGQTLFPMNVGNVLETSLTLNSPIMTPLEVPSTNSKKIMDAESDILTTRVPKNVDLPITITDPNISQTVSHQQVLMASDLQTNLELTLPMSETAMSVTSGMNSPSFVYSLPNLGVAEHTEVNQKSYSSSMPLLTEDLEETPHSFPSAIPKEGDDSSDSKLNAELPKHGLVDSIDDKRQGMIASDGTFIEEGLCSLGGEMCSSLSEPPPEMFDIPISNDGLNFLNSKSENECKETLGTSVTLTPELLTDENSMEIPVQPQIVTDLNDPPHTEISNEKECKLD